MFLCASTTDRNEIYDKFHLSGNTDRSEIGMRSLRFTTSNRKACNTLNRHLFIKRNYGSCEAVTQLGPRAIKLLARFLVAYTTQVRRKGAIKLENWF